MGKKIFYTKPSISTLEAKYAQDAALNGWGEHCFDYIKKFENEFKKFIKCNYVISTSSCTGALHMGLAALGLQSGDEVILAESNWIATAAPITYLGATPIFVDILEDSWCLNPDLVEKAITKKTKAIICTHLYGNLCELDKLLKLSERYNIPIIEDSAEAIGSFYRKSHVGTLGIFGVFSFHGTKTMTTGEGGMFVTNNKDLFEKVLTLSNHGRSLNQKKQFWPDFIGYKYKLSNIQAAIGLGQIERIEELLKRKREIFYYYKENLSDLSYISMNPEKKGMVNSFWMPTVVFEKKCNVNRESLLKIFNEQNIDARVFFYPLSDFPFFNKTYNNPVSRDIPSRAINLPSYHAITNDDLDRVIKVVREINVSQE